MRACAHVCACLVESQVERRGGTVGSQRGGAEELGVGYLSVVFFFSLFLLDLVACVSLSLSLCFSHGGSQNSAL